MMVELISLLCISCFGDIIFKGFQEDRFGQMGIRKRRVSRREEAFAEAH